MTYPFLPFPLSMTMMVTNFLHYFIRHRRNSITKYFGKNDLPFLPFLLSIFGKMSKNILTIFYKNEYIFVTIMLTCAEKKRIFLFFFKKSKN